MAETAETEVPLLTSDPPELETLELEVDGQVGTLTLNRPDALNAMSPELIGELDHRGRLARGSRPDSSADHHRRRARLLLRRGRQLVQAGRHR